MDDIEFHRAVSQSPPPQYANDCRSMVDRTFSIILYEKLHFIFEIDCMIETRINSAFFCDFLSNIYIKITGMNIKLNKKSCSFHSSKVSGKENYFL